MGNPVTLTTVLAAADDDGICASQSPSGAGSLTINGALASGGVATIATAGNERQVIVTSGGNDSGKTFTITGTSADGGGAVTDSFAGANIGVATSAKLFRTVTDVSISAASAGTVKVGTNGVGASRPVNIDTALNPPNVSIQTAVSGTVNYTVQYTFGDLQSSPVWIDDNVLAAQTAAGACTYATAVTGIRTYLNSGTGTVTTRVVQVGLG